MRIRSLTITAATGLLALGCRGRRLGATGAGARELRGLRGQRCEPGPNPRCGVWRDCVRRREQQTRRLPQRRRAA
jgi:hypothetical protein